MKLNVLVVGSGARENALAWKIKQSLMLDNLYLAGANDGFKDLGQTIEFNSNEELVKKAKELGVDLVVIGPEAPLAQGLADDFNKYNIKCIGANKKWAYLEGSKSFAKDFMQRNGIKTAQYAIAENKAQADKVLAEFEMEYHIAPVLKADGLAAGKGVYIPIDYNDAKVVLNEFLDGKFKDASSKVVVEEFLEGEELSIIALWDGKTLKPLKSARDYKRLKDKNLGPNTGGMGAYCPVKLSQEQKQDLDNYLETLESALKKENADFCGVVYSGLILTKDGIKVLEYNMRFGDPETQPLMMNLSSDILEIFWAMAHKELDQVEIEWEEEPSYCVVIAAKGYPEAPKKGCEIKNIKNIKEHYGVEIFFAGVKKQDAKLLSDGGRVLSICKTGQNALDDIYKAAQVLEFEDKIYRCDIGVKK